MSEPTNLEVMPPPPADLSVQAPNINVTEEEAAQILEELMLKEVKPITEKEAGKNGVEVRKQIRLGIFAEEVGGVRLRSGVVLVSEQILMEQMHRLRTKAQELTTIEELKAITYPMVQVHNALARNNKAKVIVEYLAPDKQGPVSRESWHPGEKVLPPAKTG